ncbi:MAG: pimeloyl-CoA dehydrogenase small subunit [Gammaproteobacteria bacterium]|nr:pimeloyl-CoA dehydrogenase small subunit [Gammaproteobacteria bacterium]
MDFSFSDEQNLIQGQVEQFIQRDYDWEKRQSLVLSELGFSEENWKTFAELGWLGISLSENSGGFGGNAIETMIVMEEFGKGLVVEPFLETIVLGATLVDLAATSEQKKEILLPVISGDLQLALAFTEPQSRFNLFDITTEAKHLGKDFILNGFKSVVMNGPAANKFIVTTRTSGNQRDSKGVTLFIVDSDSQGLTLRNYKTVDGRRASELTLEQVKVPSDSMLGSIDNQSISLEEAVDIATLALCAEAVGIMEVLYKSTVEYAKTREQFGQPIGKFQVLQHRMVDMFMEYEQSKSLMYMSTMKHAEKSADAKKSISGLKYQIGKAGKFIGQQAIQIHGGMGVTDELNIGHFFKRLTTIGTIFGNSDFHLKRYSVL